jgi:hypothetical protein
MGHAQKKKRRNGKKYNESAKSQANGVICDGAEISVLAKRQCRLLAMIFTIPKTVMQMMPSARRPITGSPPW